MTSTPPSSRSNQSVEDTRATAVLTHANATDSHHMVDRSFDVDVDTSIGSSNLSLYTTMEVDTITVPFTSAENASPFIPQELVSTGTDGYYYGLPSNPQLIARSDKSIWVQLRSEIDSGFAEKKVLLPVSSSHPICKIWDTPLGPQLLNTIDELAESANSVDLVRISYERFIDQANPIVWIGVEPNTMSEKAGERLVRACTTLLREHGFSDVEVEVREAEIHKMSGSSLYDPFDRSIDYGHKPVTTLLSATPGLAITSNAKPFSYGSISFFIRDDYLPEAVLALTCQHVISGVDNINNKGLSLAHPKYRNSDSSEKVRLPDIVFQKVHEKIDTLIRIKQGECRKASDFVDLAIDPDRQRNAQNRLNIHQEALKDLLTLKQRLQSNWDNEGDRIIGENYCFPPIQFQSAPDGWTEDWGLVRLHTKMLPSTNSNSLDLSDTSDFLLAQSGNAKPLLSIEKEGPLQLKGIISEDDMKEEIAVLMIGAMSGLRTGLSLTVESRVKYMENPYSDANGLFWSREWGITAFPKSKNEVFSNSGDSGGGVVSRNGRVGGILSGGSGRGRLGAQDRLQFDITYVTPMHFLLKRMEAAGLENPRLL